MSSFCCADFLKLQSKIERAIRSNGQSAIAYLDLKMKNKLNEKGSEINKELLLKGLLKPFPKNCISVMTITGAKGSTVSWYGSFDFLYYPIFCIYSDDMCYYLKCEVMKSVSIHGVGFVWKSLCQLDNYAHSMLEG